ncbi:MAG: hypothetical protein ACREMB_18390 [Candidatus Rokuibacteriota bacterium]
MLVRDLPGWPPQWSGLYRGRFDFPQGEVGTLWAAAVDPETQTLNLAIDLDGDYATGLVPLPPRLLRPVEQLLRESLGLSLDAVGALAFEVD